MSAIENWSTTAASNNAASPNGWPEGMPPSGVNDSARENMAQIKTWWEQIGRNFITGLTLSNDTDADHDIAIAAGAARDATNAVDMALSATLTKQIDATWAVGDDAGGLDTGSVGNSTLYAVWLIKRSDTGVVDALFSTSFTSPTMPTNYDYKRLIGAVKTDGSANIIAFTQVGDYFRYTGDVITDVSDSTITDNTFEVGTLSAPPNSLAHIYANATNTAMTGANLNVYVRYNGSADAASLNEAFAAIQNANPPDSIGGIGFVLTDGSGQIQYAAKEPDGTATVTISTFGFQMLTRSNPL